MPDQIIIECARKIAIYRGYPKLDNGLQPVEDYQVEGVKHLGLNSKYQAECLELRDAWASWQSKQGKTEWHVLHEAADVYYYSQQIEEQEPERACGYWAVSLRSVHLYLPHPMDEEQVKAAAHAKYAWRSAQPGNKDEAPEIALIKRVVPAL